MSYDKYVKITDFRTNDAFTVRGLKCRLIGSSEILADQGRIELRGNNVYRMVAEGKSFDFCVQDAQDERQLADKMKQYPYNLAGISGKGQNVFFFAHCVLFSGEMHAEIQYPSQQRNQTDAVPKALCQGEYT